MSNKKAVTNIYDLFDNELARMHSLLAAYLKLPQEEEEPLMRTRRPSAVQTRDIPMIYQRIREMQDILIKQFADRDEVIQNKVAELALTGVADSETK